MPDANDPLLTRIEDALVRLTGARDASLLLAVSGGPDSMAMLDLVRRCWTGPVAAATVDHGLRKESADEAAMVAGFCADMAVPHATLRPAAAITGSLQSAARAARYALLQSHADQCGAAFIVTAHHADDQLETLMMRLARGSGVDGMAGVRARNGRIIRPLLGCRKTELVAHCDSHGIAFVSDPSNANTDFDRVRMRHALCRFDAIDPMMAIRTAEALADAASALDWITAREALSAIVISNAGVELSCADYPAGLLRRLVERCLDVIQPGLTPRGVQIDRLIQSLQSGEQAMIGDILCRPATDGQVWHFAPAPRRGAGLRA